jgi:hypothetical protein
MYKYAEISGLGITLREVRGGRIVKEKVTYIMWSSFTLDFKHLRASI